MDFDFVVMVWMTIIVAGYLIVDWYLARRRFYRLLEQFPGPIPNMIFGSAFELDSSEKILPAFMRFQQNYGNAVRLFISPFTSVLLISDPDFVKCVFYSTSTIVQKIEEYRFFKIWLSQDPSFYNEDIKFEERKRVSSPAYYFKILTQLMAISESSAKVLVDKLRQEIEKPFIDIYSFLIKDDTPMNEEEDYKIKYLRYTMVALQIILDTVFNPILACQFFNFFALRKKKERKVIKVLYKYAKSVVLQESDTEFITLLDKSDDLDVKKRLAFLELLSKESCIRNGLTDKQILEEIDTFLAVDQDTIASTLSFVLFCLASNSMVQKKAIDEQKKIFKNDKERFPTLDDLYQMIYLEAVIKETLRFYPPVPYYARKVRQTIKYDGRILPKGLILVVNVYGIHRRPDLFYEPYRFDPDRFLPRNYEYYEPYSYMPFSMGTRNCFGQKFAMLEMKITLSILLRNFEFLPVVPKHKLNLVVDNVLKSKNGVLVSLRNRQL